MSDVILTSRQRAQTQTREALLDAAWDLAVEKGFEALSIADIAERAGFTKGAFYSNFASREDIILHLVQTFVRLKPDAIYALPARAASAGLAAALDEYAAIVAVHVLDRRRWTIVAEVQLFIARNPSVSEAIRADLNRMWDELANVLEALASQANVILTLRPLQAARSLLAVTQGLAQQPGTNADAQQIIRFWLRMLFCE